MVVPHSNRLVHSLWLGRDDLFQSMTHCSPKPLRRAVSLLGFYSSESQLSSSNLNCSAYRTGRSEKILKSG